MWTDWKRLVSIAVVTVSSAWQGQALAAPSKGPTEYRVVAGDTCGKVAQKVYGDGKYIEFIHQHNKLGPKPHRLKAGMVLVIVPPETASVAEGPDAQLTFVRNEVEAYTPGYHPGRRDEPLLRGHRVGTRESSSAQITFRDETQLQLSENTLVVILGDTSQRSTRERRGETVLLRGSLMARLGDLAGTKPTAVATPGGRVEFVSGQNEAHLAVDEKKPRACRYTRATRAWPLAASPFRWELALVPSRRTESLRRHRARCLPRRTGSWCHRWS